MSKYKDKNKNFSHNKFAIEHHNRIKSKGYWDEPQQFGTLLMLIVTEMVKLFDSDRSNTSEKLADTALRLYDLLAYYNVDLSILPEVDDFSLHSMVTCLTNELEAQRVNIDTKFVYLKRCLSMCYLFANKNNINLELELERKTSIMMYMPKKKF